MSNLSSPCFPNNPSCAGCYLTPIWSFHVLSRRVSHPNNSNFDHSTIPLTKFSFIVKLTHRIEMRSTTTQGTRKEHRDSEYFHKTFPYFIWLLRDVTQAIPSDCSNIKEYFLKKVKFRIRKRKNIRDHHNDD